MYAANSQSEGAVSDSIRELNKKKAEAISSEIIKERKKTNKNKGINKEIDIKKPLKECIKENNKVDEEVKKCMEGRLEKTW